MDSSILRNVGAVAGIAGLGLGVFLVLVRLILQHRSLSAKLTKLHTYKLLNRGLVLSWVLAIAGLAAWLGHTHLRVNGQITEKSPPPAPPVDTKAGMMPMPPASPTPDRAQETRQNLNEIREEQSRPPSAGRVGPPAQPEPDPRGSTSPAPTTNSATTNSAASATDETGYKIKNRLISGPIEVGDSADLSAGNIGQRGSGRSDDESIDSEIRINGIKAGDDAKIKIGNIEND